MSVIKNGYNPKVEQNRKEEKDYLLKEVTNKEGTTELVEKVVNYTEIQKRNGTVDKWDIQTLKDAGVKLEGLTPKTTENSKIEGVGKAIESAEEVTRKIKEEIKKK